MLSEIQSIDITGDINNELLYLLIKSESTETNLTLLSILQNFQKSSDFFEYSTKINITSVNNSLKQLENNLLSLQNIKIIKNGADNNINQYLSSISNIILTFNFFMRIQNVLNVVFKTAKNNLYNCKIKQNNFKSLYSLITLMDNFYNYINSKDNEQKFLTSFPTNSVSTDNTPKNLLNQKDENCLFQINFTPRFENEFGDNKNSSNLISDSLNSRESELTLFDMKFSYKEFSSILLQKKSNSGGVNEKQKNIEKNGDEIEIYMELLTTINESYKLCLINAEEKIKIKQLILSKFEEVKRIYFEYYDYLRTNKKKFIEKFKKLLK